MEKKNLGILLCLLCVQKTLVSATVVLRSPVGFHKTLSGGFSYSLLLFSGMSVFLWTRSCLPNNIPMLIFYEIVQWPPRPPTSCLGDSRAHVSGGCCRFLVFPNFLVGKFAMYCMWGAVCCVVSVLKLFLPFLAATLRRPRDEEEVPQRVKSDLYASL